MKLEDSAGHVMIGSGRTPIAARAANCAFSSGHATMVFVVAGRAASAQALLEAQEPASEREVENAGFALEGDQAAAHAIRPFGEGGHAQVIQLLGPVRHVAHRFGGGRVSMACEADPHMAGAGSFNGPS